MTITLVSRDAVGNYHMYHKSCNSACARAAYCGAKLPRRFPRNSGASGMTPHIRKDCAARRPTPHVSWNTLYSIYADNAQRDGVSATNAVALGPPWQKRDGGRSKPALPGANVTARVPHHVPHQLLGRLFLEVTTSERRLRQLPQRRRAVPDLGQLILHAGPHLRILQDCAHFCLFTDCNLREPGCPAAGWGALPPHAGERTHELTPQTRFWSSGRAGVRPSNLLNIVP